MALWAGGGTEFSWLYKSKKWKATRAAYLQAHPNCEVCESRGIVTAASVVHHLEHVTQETAKDADLLYGFDNLMAVCAKCHFEEHHKPRVQRLAYDFDEDGNIIEPATQAKQRSGR